jgi:hypothetical protein
LPDSKLRTVRELRTRPRNFLSRVRQDPQARGERQSSQRDHHEIARQESDFALDVLPAVVEFLRQRPIRRGRAPARGGDERPDQLQPVPAMARVRLIRQAGLVHRPEEEVPGLIPGEHPSGPVAAVGRRRQPDDQDPRLRVPERRDRPPPVALAAKSARRIRRRELPPCNQTRTPPARDHLALDPGDAVGGFLRAQLRAYRPIRAASARMCPFIARSTSAFVATEGSFNSASRA